MTGFEAAGFETIGFAATGFGATLGTARAVPGRAPAREAAGFGLVAVWALGIEAPPTYREMNRFFAKRRPGGALAGRNPWIRLESGPQCRPRSLKPGLTLS